MKAKQQLPSEYRQTLHIDLQKDKKNALIVNVMSFVIMLAMILMGNFITPISCFIQEIFPLIFVMMAGTLIYTVLHELVHGIFIRIFSGIRPHYGFTGLYAYAGSNAYFDRLHYTVIALAPVVIWGIVLAALCAVTRGKWFWVVYFLETYNISGASGDFYVVWRFSKLSKDILIQDTGIAMTVFEKM